MRGVGAWELAAGCAAALMLLAAPFAPAWAQPAQRSEVIAVAELRSLTLVRRDWEAERREWAARSDDEPLVISNACGRADATFRVIRSTAPLDPEVTVSESIGEWCELPLEFGNWRWLIVLDGDTGALVEYYPLFVHNGALFAQAERESDRIRSEPVRSLLALTPIPEPLEYDVSGIPPQRLDEWVARRPALELREGKVWLVRAIAVAAIFPGLTEESLEP